MSFFRRGTASVPAQPIQRLGAALAGHRQPDQLSVALKDPADVLHQPQVFAELLAELLDRHALLARQLKWALPQDEQAVEHQPVKGVALLGTDRESRGPHARSPALGSRS